MIKRILAVILSAVMLFSVTDFVVQTDAQEIMSVSGSQVTSGDVVSELYSETSVSGSDIAGVNPGIVTEMSGGQAAEKEEVQQSQVQQSLYEQLMAAETMEAFHAILFDEANYDAVFALTAEEVANISAYASALPSADADKKAMVEETLELLAEGTVPVQTYAAFDGYTKLTQAKLATYMTSGGGAYELPKGKYYLSENITTYAEIHIYDEVIFDLNGYVMECSAWTNFSKGIADGWQASDYTGKAHRAFYISSTGHLTINDSRPTVGHAGTYTTVSRWSDLYYINGSYHDDPTKRYAWKTTEDKRMWVWDGTGPDIIQGGIITGAVSTNGSIFVHGGKLTINGGSLIGNHTYRYQNADGSFSNPAKAGTVYADHGATVWMNGGAIKYNWCDTFGGAVNLYGASKFYMYSGVIDHNSAQYSGGGIFLREESTFYLGDPDNEFTRKAAPQITNNRTYSSYLYGGGGGIEVSSANLVYRVGRIAENYATSGAGIYCYRGGNVEAESAQSIIEDNTALNGAGIMIQYGKVKLTDCIVRNNHATAAGGGAAGGVHVRVGSFEMYGGELSGNTSTGSAGGVYVTAQNNVTPHGDPGNLGGGTAILQNVKIHNNTAKNNGGAMVVTIANSSADLTVDVENCDIQNNSVGGRGAAIYLEGGTLNVTGGTVVKNNSAKEGGAFFVSDRDRSKPTSDSQKPYANKPGIGDELGANGNLYSNVVFLTTPEQLVKPGVFNVYNGTFENNEATKDGGVACVTGAKCQVNIYGGTFNTNTADANGGAIHVSGGGNMKMIAGSMSGNTAANGGAVSVGGGSFTMYGGTIQKSTAVIGGAVYVTGGNFVMTDEATPDGGAKVSECVAQKGGAAYIQGGDFKIEFGELVNNGTQEITQYGGAVCVEGGNVVVGIQGCTQNAVAERHKPDRHPVVQNNNAQYGGGFSINKGILTLYCSKIIQNQSDNKGTGNNIFMDGGSTYHYYEGALVGDPEDHGIVVIGGTFKAESSGTAQDQVEIIYHSNFWDSGMEEDQWKGNAPDQYYLNLPYCPEEWSRAQAAKGLVIVGWAPHPNVSEAKSIRDKSDYRMIGDPFQVKEQSNNKPVELYAVWGPLVNGIHYMYSLDGVNITDYNSEEIFQGYQDYYNFEYVKSEVPLGTPEVTGYTFKEWRMYAGTDDISNWGRDATYIVGSPDLSEVPYVLPDSGKLETDRNFGEIVLIAVFEENQATINYVLVGPDGSGTISRSSETIPVVTGDPQGSTATAAYKYKVTGWFTDADCTDRVTEGVSDTDYGNYITQSTLDPQRASGEHWKDGTTYYVRLEYALADLTITKTVSDIDYDPDQVFIFKVKSTENNVDMYVTVKGRGSVVISDLLVGDYTVEEETGWSWRFTPDQTEKSVRLTGAPASVEFVNILSTDDNDKKWLDGISSVKNLFNGIAPAQRK